VKHEKRIVGVSFAIQTQKGLYLWLGGYEKETLSQLQSSYFLLNQTILYGIQNQLDFIEGGRSPYRPKFQHGMKMTPIHAACFSKNERIMNLGVQWLKELEQLHYQQYELTS
jgi:hypothetical protein